MCSDKTSRGDPTVTSSSVPEELRNDLIKIRVEHLYTIHREAQNAVIEFSTTGLKGLILVNGGGIIALLTFLGQQKTVAAGADNLWWAFISLSAGLFLSLSAILLAYVSQRIVSDNISSSAEKIFFHSIGEHEKSKTQEASEGKAYRRGIISNCVAVLCAVLSAVAFLAGSGFALKALTLVTAVK